MDAEHHRLAQIGLQAAGRYGFALAGGYAVQAHGILVRPSDDIDLFTGWDHRHDFDEGVEAMLAAYAEAGYRVEVVQRFDTFARIHVISESDPANPHKVELAANWRANQPILMDIGPVLHPDDVVTGKMSALYTRAEPRDFLDVDAAVEHGGYSRERVCELSEQADPGFDRAVLRQVLQMLDRYPDRRFTAYGVDAGHIAAMRDRFRNWIEEL